MTAPASASDPAILEPDLVKVRMYKNLLGDCLLITLRKDEEASHILIDCGVLQGTKGAGTTMNAVVEDIYRTTGHKPLDLVVVTHEHHDHISGFGFAHDKFKANGIATLWMAWTEDPADPDGIDYQARFGNGFAILGGLSQQLKIPHTAVEDEDGLKLGLAGFSGPLANEAAAGNDGDTKRARPVRGSRKIYRDLHRTASETKFLSPGHVLTTPGKVGLPTYVLGPPRDLKMLTRALPSAATPETYFGAAPDGGRSADPGSPFSRQPVLNIRDVKAAQPHAADDLAICQQRYFGPWGVETDFDRGACQQHRQIDNSARSIFATLALKMDNNTNNTSLVLAFDLPGTAGTMLFAADAQVGNWLSWDKVEFRRNPKDEPLPVTSAGLLARTRFYKVGHHGSHNATLKEQGLERMLGRDFVSMVPTDAKFARQQSSGWLMPNPRVEEALFAKGLVLRGDRACEDSLAEHGARLDDEGKTRFDDWAMDRFEDSRAKNEEGLPLYIEYTVYDRARDGPTGG